MSDATGRGGGQTETTDPRLAPIVGVAAAVTLLASVGVVPDWPGLVHMTGLPPFGFFADLRVLLADASLPWFVVGLAASLVARGLALAAMLGRLDRAGLGFAMRFYGIALAPGLVAATLSFAGHALLFALFQWAAIGVVLVAAGALAASPWSEGDGVRARLAAVTRRGFRFGAVAPYLGGLVVLSFAAEHIGRGGRLLLVGLSAALTWAAVRFLVRRPQEARARRAAGLAGGVVVVAVVALAFTLPGEGGRDVPGRRSGSLFLVSGVSTASGSGSLFDLDPTALGFGCEQTFYFSYAGPGGGAPRRDAVCEIRSGAPYDEADSQRALDEVVGGLAPQVRSLPRPVTVVAHSQGAWIVAEALARGGVTVDRLVMLGPFPRHPVAYDPVGTDPAGSGALRLLLDGLDAVVGVGFEADAPLATELLGRTGALDRLMRRRPPATVEALAVTSWLDLPVAPEGWRVAWASDACPLVVYHGSMVGSAAVDTTVNRFLDGEQPAPCPAWRRNPPPATLAFGVPAG